MLKTIAKIPKRKALKKLGIKEDQDIIFGHLNQGNEEYLEITQWAKSKNNER